jgi:hypothetical protein
MEPTKVKVSIGEFRVIDTQLNAIRITLGHGVNAWIHMNFEHNIQPGDKLILFAEVPYAIPKPTPIE